MHRSSPRPKRTAPSASTLRPRSVLFAAGTCMVSANMHLNAQPIELQPVPRINIVERANNYAGKYEKQSVIRVRTFDQNQLDVVLRLAETVWSERTGVGLLDVQIRNEHIPSLIRHGITHDVLIDNLQAHTNAAWTQIVQQEIVDLQRVEQEQRGASVHDEGWFSNYKQLADINAYYNNIAALRPDLATMADIGDSVESNDIYALTITAPDEPGNLAEDRPVVLWHGATHAREWISPMTVAYLASKFVDSYDTDTRVENILKTARIVIVPVTNPDGYLYSWSNERFWRKNRRINSNGSRGVDINRNWGYEWGGEGASSSSSDDTYRGPSSFSEPENQTLRDLAFSYGDQFAAHIDYHSYSQLILWPFGYASNAQTPEPDRTFYDNLATDLSGAILDHSGVFYNPIQSVELYPAAGNSSDWFYGELGAKSLTFELRPSSGGLDGFDPPPSTILPTAQENFEAAKLFIERTTQQLVMNSISIEFVEADQPALVNLSITDVLLSHDPTQVTLFARTTPSDSYAPSLMSETSMGEFQGILPSASCDSEIQYYFSVETIEGLTVNYPVEGDLNPLTTIAQEVDLAFEDTMETDNGWTVGATGDSATTGVWNRMDPEGTDAQPENDHTPEGSDCWVTDGFAGTSLGNRDIDGGATTLTSPMLDAIAVGDEAQLVYWRWYSNDQGSSPNEDSMRVQMSTDNGFSWVTLETVTENTDRWVEKRFRIADFETPTDQMRIRFVASDHLNPSIVEAGVDDLRIEAVGCSPNPADLNGDGVLNFFDVSLFLNAYNTLDPIADFNKDGDWNFFDVSAFLAAFNNG